MVEYYLYKIKIHPLLINQFPKKNTFDGFLDNPNTD